MLFGLCSWFRGTEFLKPLEFPDRSVLSFVIHKEPLSTTPEFMLMRSLIVGPLHCLMIGWLPERPSNSRAGSFIPTY